LEARARGWKLTGSKASLERRAMTMTRAEMHEYIAPQACSVRVKAVALPLALLDEIDDDDDKTLELKKKIASLEKEIASLKSDDDLEMSAKKELESELAFALKELNKLKPPAPAPVPSPAPVLAPPPSTSIYARRALEEGRGVAVLPLPNRAAAPAPLCGGGRAAAPAPLCGGGRAAAPATLSLDILSPDELKMLPELVSNTLCEYEGTKKGCRGGCNRLHREHLPMIVNRATGESPTPREVRIATYDVTPGVTKKGLCWRVWSVLRAELTNLPHIKKYRK